MAKSTRTRWWMVAVLPLVGPWLMASASEDSGELSGGLGQYQYSSCGTTYNVRHWDAGLQYQHRSLDDHGSGPELRVSGAVRSEAIAIRAQTGEVTHRSDTQAVGRALLGYDGSYAAFGLGLAVRPRSEDDTPVLPALRLRLGPRQAYFHTSLMDGGIVNSAQHVFTLGCGFGMDPEIPVSLNGRLGVELEDHTAYLALALRLQVQPAYFVLAGRVANPGEANVTVGIGFRLASRDDPEVPRRPAPRDQDLGHPPEVAPPRVPPDPAGDSAAFGVLLPP
jgi:hypothetical protein